ncbi:PIN domain-containing protein [Nostocoides australiense]|nr:PIN domain-containing protein [Actinomycetota bacterium]
MALIARYLIDTSAAARMRHPEVAERLVPLIEGALVATCPTLDAEALFVARDAPEYAAIRENRQGAYEHLPLENAHWELAFDAQQALAVTGRHRAVGIADLLTAVLAQEHRLTVIHYDADFEFAGEVLHFAQAWVRPRGSLS